MMKGRYATLSALGSFFSAVAGVGAVRHALAIYEGTMTTAQLWVGVVLLLIMGFMGWAAHYDSAGYLEE